MKKSNLIKLFSILLMSVMLLMFINTIVLAADTDLTSGLNIPTSNNTNNVNTNNTNINTNNTNVNNSNTNRNNTNVNNSNTNNTNIYNTNNLPKTGIEDSIPVALLVVVFGISAVYAYKKIKDYRNI